MAQGYCYLYGAGAEQLIKGEIDLLQDTIKIACLTSGYVFDRNTHSTFFDISPYELTGTNYPAGGWTISGKAVRKDTSDSAVRILWDDLIIPNVTIHGVKNLAYYRDDADPSKKFLIACVALDTAYNCDGNAAVIDHDGVYGMVSWYYY
jgi:hypothetical protein